MCDINNCGICLESLEKTNICTTSCGHTFCLKCIIKNTNYNNDCPYCRKKIVENEKENDEYENDEQENDEQENNEQINLYNYIGRIDYEECYHFPVVIEDIQCISKVINEITGGTFSSDNGLGWIIGILSIINDNEEIKFNFIDDKSYENEEAEYSKLIIMETIYIYKRSILLKKHLQNKIK